MARREGRVERHLDHQLNVGVRHEGSRPVDERLKDKVAAERFYREREGHGVPYPPRLGYDHKYHREHHPQYPAVAQMCKYWHSRVQQAASQIVLDPVQYSQFHVRSFPFGAKNKARGPRPPGCSKLFADLYVRLVLRHEDHVTLADALDGTGFKAVVLAVEVLVVYDDPYALAAELVALALGDLVGLAYVLT